MGPQSVKITCTLRVCREEQEQGNPSARPNIFCAVLFGHDWHRSHPQEAAKVPCVDLTFFFHFHCAVGVKVVAFASYFPSALLLLPGSRDLFSIRWNTKALPLFERTESKEIPGEILLKVMHDTFKISWMWYYIPTEQRVSTLRTFCKAAAQISNKSLILAFHCYWKSELGSSAEDPSLDSVQHSEAESCLNPKLSAKITSRAQPK